MWCGEMADAALQTDRPGHEVMPINLFRRLFPGMFEHAFAKSSYRYLFAAE
jgi:hypothetical protein